MTDIIKQAFDAGAYQALADFGLTKTAAPPVAEYNPARDRENMLNAGIAKWRAAGGRLPPEPAPAPPVAEYNPARDRENMLNAGIAKWRAAGGRLPTEPAPAPPVAEYNPKRDMEDMLNEGIAKWRAAGGRLSPEFATPRSAAPRNPSEMDFTTAETSPPEGFFGNARRPPLSAAALAPAKAQRPVPAKEMNFSSREMEDAGINAITRRPPLSAAAPAPAKAQRPVPAKEMNFSSREMEDAGINAITRRPPLSAAAAAGGAQSFGNYSQLARALGAAGGPKMTGIELSQRFGNAMIHKGTKFDVAGLSQHLNAANSGGELSNPVTGYATGLGKGRAAPVLAKAQRPVPAITRRPPPSAAAPAAPSAGQFMPTSLRFTPEALKDMGPDGANRASSMINQLSKSQLAGSNLHMASPGAAPARPSMLAAPVAAPSSSSATIAPTAAAPAPARAPVAAAPAPAPAPKKKG